MAILPCFRTVHLGLFAISSGASHSSPCNPANGIAPLERMRRAGSQTAARASESGEMGQHAIRETRRNLIGCIVIGGPRPCRAETVESDSNAIQERKSRGREEKRRRGREEGWNRRENPWVWNEV